MKYFNIRKKIIIFSVILNSINKILIVLIVGLRLCFLKTVSHINRIK